MIRQPWDITREMFLSAEETDRLLAHVRSRVQAASLEDKPGVRFDQVIVESLLFSGLRNSEFCSLRLGDTPAGHGKSRFDVRARKGDDRTIYLPEHTSRLIRRYASEIRPYYLPADVDPADLSQPFVFNEHRRPYERTGLYRRVVRILTACGLGDRASVQLLRHTYGYLAYLRTGGNLLFVQRQLGHAHPMVTVVYAQFVNESYEALAQKVHAAGPARRRTDSRGGRSPSKQETTDETNERGSSRGPGNRRRHSGSRVTGGDAGSEIL